MTPEQVRRFDAELATLDECVYAAELAGHITERIALLRERARVWLALAEAMEAAGQDSVGARLAGRSDQVLAEKLSAGGWSR